MKVTTRRILKPIIIGLSLGICAVLILILSDPKSTTQHTLSTEITTRVDSEGNSSDSVHTDSNHTKPAHTNSSNSDSIITDSITPNLEPKPNQPELSGSETDKGAAPDQLIGSLETRNFNTLDSQHFKTGINLLRNKVLKTADDYRIWSKLILKSIAINHGTAAMKAFKHLLKDQVISSYQCAWSIGELLAPELPQNASFRDLTPCSRKDRGELLSFFTTLSLQPKLSAPWKSFIAEVFNSLFETNPPRSLEYHILSRVQLRSLITEEQIVAIANKLPQEELLEILEQAAITNLHLTETLATVLNNNQLVPFPRILLLRPLLKPQKLSGQLREKLARSLRGEIEPEVIELSDQLSLEEASGILIASCSLTASPEVLDRVYNNLQRSPANKGVKALVEQIKYESVVNRNSLLQAICKAAYYDDLPEADRAEVVAQFGKNVNNDLFVEAVLNLESRNLTPDFTLKHGQNFGLYILRRLENYPDSNTRQAVQQYLKWYQR